MSTEPQGRFPWPAEAMEEHTAIIGKTGAGKTYTAKSVAEDLLAEGARFAVIDPTGVWWGLKASADGESEGFPVVVFGGDHGDVPLSENDGEAVARIVATTATPCVIDVSAFPSLSAQKRFMTEFAEHVFRMNREALHLFVDEADAFMPQRPGPDEAVMLGRWDTIARRGRSRGFRLTLITQRPAVLNKNALSQVGTLIALKLTSPQDRKAVGDWIEGNADKVEGKVLLASLPSLNRGEGWVWSPGHDVLTRAQFPTITTWDSSRTPGKGEIHREAKVMARADIAAILEAMGTPTTQRPGDVAVAPDAETLRAAREQGRAEGHAAGLGEGIAASAEELTRLTADLRAVYGAAADNARAAVEYATRLRTAIAERHPAAVAGLEEPALWLMDMRRAATPKSGAEYLEELLGDRFGLEAVDTGQIRAVGRKLEEPAPPEAVESADAVTRARYRFSPAAHRLALALAVMWPASILRTTWGTLANVAEGGGTFSTALRQLREAGFYDEATQRASATEACREYAAACGGPAFVGDTAAQWAMWLDTLPANSRKVLEALRDMGGKATRSALAATAGFAAGGGTFSTALKVLRDNELLTASREGGVLHDVSDLARRVAGLQRNRNARR